MTNLQKHIDEPETKAAESALIAKLATDPEAREPEHPPPQELGERAEKLRQQQHPSAS